MNDIYLSPMNMQYEELVFYLIFHATTISGLHVDSSFAGWVIYRWVGLMMVQALLMLVSVHLDYRFVLGLELVIILGSDNNSCYWLV